MGHEGFGIWGLDILKMQDAGTAGYLGQVRVRGVRDPGCLGMGATLGPRLLAHIPGVPLSVCRRRRMQLRIPGQSCRALYVQDAGAHTRVPLFTCHTCRMLDLIRALEYSQLCQPLPVLLPTVTCAGLGC